MSMPAIQIDLYEALTEAGVKPDAARRVERQVELAIVSGHEAVRSDMLDRLMTKEDGLKLRAELKQDMADLRAELKQDTTALRNELKQDTTALRNELKQDIADLRTELKQDIAELRAEFRCDITDVHKALGSQTLRILGLVFVMNSAMLAASRYLSA